MDKWFCKRERFYTVILVALQLLILISLTSCKNEGLIAVPGHARELRLVMKPGMSETAKQSMQYFSYKVSQLSKNRLKVVINETENPVAELSTSHFLFLPNDEIRKVSSGFSPFESPFYFSDYTHLTMSLNSETFWRLNGDMIKSLIEVRPMGAFYDGNSVLISAFENMLDTLDQYNGAKIYITEDEMFEFTLKKFGSEVFIKEPLDLIEGFNNGKYRNIECSTLLLEGISIPPKSNTIILCHTFHKAKINWLFLSTETVESFTKVDMAILSEAAAFALAQNDRAIIEAEERGIAHIESLKATQSKPNYNEFFKQTAEILKKSAKYGNIWNWEQYELVKEIANIE